MSQYYHLPHVKKWKYEVGTRKAKAVKANRIGIARAAYTWLYYRQGGRDLRRQGCLLGGSRSLGDIPIGDRRWGGRFEG